MDAGKKSSLRLVYTVRRYWWVFAAVVAVIVFALLRAATVPEDGQSKVPTLSPAPLGQAPTEQQEPEANTPTLSKPQPSADDVQLPYPEDVEAIARYYGSNGPPNIRDVAVIWEKQQDRYINFLDSETFEQGLYRSYTPSELAFVLGNQPNFLSSNPDVIRIFARTRRFSRLVSRVMLAKEQGYVQNMVASMDATVKRFIKERQSAEQQISRLMKEQPEVFGPSATEQQRRRLLNLLWGCGSTALDAAEGVIPISLQGTQLGVVANAFLLGLTEHPEAVRPLLDILAYQDEPLISQLSEIWQTDNELIRSFYCFANRPVVADGLDRVLVACSDSTTVAPEAADVAAGYKQWRDARALSPREVVQLYRYDAHRTPHHLPGSVTGVPEDADRSPLELPLDFGTSRVDLYEFDEETIAGIIAWAERFNAALKGQ